MNTIDKILFNAYLNKEKVRLFYGDKRTGKDWNEIDDVFGYIGYSMGTQRLPLLIRYKNSTGGCPIVTSCIVKIMINGIVVYKHPDYHSLLTLNGNNIYSEGNVALSFNNEAKAQRMFSYLQGCRNSY